MLYAQQIVSGDVDDLILWIPSGITVNGKKPEDKATPQGVGFFFFRPFISGCFLAAKAFDDRISATPAARHSRAAFLCRH